MVWETTPGKNLKVHPIQLSSVPTIWGFIFEPLLWQLAKTSCTLKERPVESSFLCSAENCLCQPLPSGCTWKLNVIPNSISFLLQILSPQSKHAQCSYSTVPSMTILLPSWSPSRQFSKSWIQKKYTTPEMVVTAQSSKRWDLDLIWEGALPGAHRLTLLHLANNSFNPQLKHHAFQKTFPARFPSPIPPATPGRGPALYGHSSLCQPLSQHILHHEEVICLCIELSPSIVSSPKAGVGWLNAGPLEPGTEPKRWWALKKKKKVQLKWTELEYWNLS